MRLSSPIKPNGGHIHPTPEGRPEHSQMSVIGTGVAAGVAQTGLQAKEVAKRKDRAETDSAKEARRMRETLEGHLRALEEGDRVDINSPTNVRIDEQIPEHESGSTIDSNRRRGKAQTSNSYGADGSGKGLNHVDVKA